MSLHFCPEAVSVEARSPYILITRFADGKTTSCDLSDIIKTEAFSHMASPDAFAKVHISHGAAAFDETLEIAPEYLYWQ